MVPSPRWLFGENPWRAGLNEYGETWLMSLVGEAHAQNHLEAALKFTFTCTTRKWNYFLFLAHRSAYFVGVCLIKVAIITIKLDSAITFYFTSCLHVACINIYAYFVCLWLFHKWKPHHFCVVLYRNLVSFLCIKVSATMWLLIIYKGGQVR